MAIESSRTKTSVWRRWVHDLIGTTTPNVLTARGSAGSTIVSSSETQLATLSIVIPDHWGSYDLEYIVGGRWDEQVGTTTNTTLDIRLRVGDGGTGKTGTVLVTARIMLDGVGESSEHDAGAIGFTEGASTTGTLTWSFNADTNGTTNIWRIESPKCIIRAWRTS